MKTDLKILAFSLWTADSVMLTFPDSKKDPESYSPEVGMVGILADDKLADGKYLMPDGVTLTIKKGKLIKTDAPTNQSVLAYKKKLIVEKTSIFCKRITDDIHVLLKNMEPKPRKPNRKPFLK
jgi:hypothetical protein